ncbi:hypothetical protein SAMN05660216_02190 [Pseudomonas sp. LAMO17WK12:I8]|nr:hypothetical protein SAMN05660216_02190 [Pseudomonas sp. LAMO17WK12:I8]SNY21860.1 hypothetical protein SAMN05660700_02193 [Pseudomonas sp. LAMO17WK12:I7]SNY23759.1 hypothetical protein SAMN05660344_02517 [Pseudomonas sp. LAMO17WK12:I11]SNY26573.1 hypothetical protein SAMN05660893_02890 [Pseudomonas sp. LAMO17WK12:I12]
MECDKLEEPLAAVSHHEWLAFRTRSGAYKKLLNVKSCASCRAVSNPHADLRTADIGKFQNIAGSKESPDGSYLRSLTIAEAIASALSSRACKQVIVLSWAFTDPRCLIHVLTSSMAALKAVWFICNSSRASAVAAALSSMCGVLCDHEGGLQAYTNSSLHFPSDLIALSSSSTSSVRLVPSTAHKSLSCTMSSRRVPLSTSLIKDCG